MLRNLAVSALVLLAGACFVLQPGLIHPDEIFQALEPANRLAFGFGVKAWEWDVGLRNWAFPGALAGLLRLGAVLGLDDVWARRGLIALPALALHFAALQAVFRFASRRLGAPLARWSIALVGASPVVLLFACRTLSESLSAAFLVIAFERLEAADVEGRRAALVSGALFGLAEVARYGSAPFIVVTLVWLAVKRSRWLLPLVLGGGGVALALGALDALTWGQTLEAPHLGGWWHSLLEYTDFNLLKGKAGGFGRSPWWAYFPAFGVFAVVPSVIAWRWRAELRAALPLLASSGYLLSIIAVPHKEERFLYPATLVLLMVAAPSFIWVASRLSLRPVVIGSTVLLVTLLSAALVPDGLRPRGSELIRLTARAQREGSGLLIVQAGLWGTGGSFFAGGSNLMRFEDDARPTTSHRWCTADGTDACFARAIADESIDRAILLEPFEPARQTLLAAGFRAVGTVGEAAWFER